MKRFRAIIGHMPVFKQIETPLETSEFQVLGDHVRAVLATSSGDEPPAMPASLASALGTPGGPVHVAVRDAGEIVAQTWTRAEDRSWAEALQEALVEVAEDARATGGAPSTVEIVFSHTPRAIFDVHDGAAADTKWFMGNVRRGITTLELEHDDAKHLLSPYYVIARNLGHNKILQEYRELNDVSPGAWEKLRVTAWQTYQFLVPCGTKAAAAPRYRGTSMVAPEDITRDSVEAFTTTLGNYLFEHVNEDGHLTYRMVPSEGEDLDPTENNMIRQWMATIAMNRTAAYRGKDRKLYEIIERNIRYNLRHYYRAQGSIGLVEYDNHINLGSVALAAQGLMEHPNRASFGRAERKLLNAVQWCWDKGKGTGQFCTVIHPLNMDHGNNFYPGEALLTWSMIYRENKDPKLLEQFMRSFLYYKQWHLVPENRKPAFVPWHVQAYFNMWEITGDERLASWIFEMSDWLLGVQPKKNSVPDAAGQFFDPRRPQFGYPHASSTGVYIEGLIDAYELAKRKGDAKRQDAYRESLVRGIRSCMQLTFKDDLECFYGYEPRRLLGGTRTSIFNNHVRCDNVQHNLMGILKCLQRFEDGEFEHPRVQLGQG